MRRLVLALIVLVVLAALAAAVNMVVPLPGGPLSPGGSGWSSPERAGVPLTAGAFALRNEGSRRLVVEEIELPKLDGVDYLGTVVPRNGAPGFPAAEGFPPSAAAFRVGSVRPVDGFELPPHASTQLLIGFQGEPGDYLIEPVEVVYRMKLLGDLGIRFRRELTTRLGVCLRGGAARPRCDPPDSSD